MTSKKPPTPMMQQWHACKENAQNALLLFQMGDFYELFYSDAEAAAKELDLTLTKRQEIPMAGVPVHTLDSYVERLVAKGHRVAIATQTENPQQAKGLVKREIVRVVTPGTITTENSLQEKSNNFFVALSQVGALYGLAFADLSTGEFRCSEFEESGALARELYRLRPAEIYTSIKFEKAQKELLNELKENFHCLVTAEDGWRFEHKLCYETLRNLLKVESLDGFGLKGLVAAINAAGALISYLQDTLLHSLDHITEMGTYSTEAFMALDRTTQTNLEIVHPKAERGRSLLSILDLTQTAMGGRLLKQMLLQPLLSLTEITHRREAVSALFDNRAMRSRCREQLAAVRDIERLSAKVKTASASPKDLASLAYSLRSVPFLQETISKGGAPLLAELTEAIHPLPDLVELIEATLTDEPPLRLSDGGVIRSGVHEELDQYRQLRSDSKSWLQSYQESLRAEHDIKTLKVGYNRMFGYYIEVSKGQSLKMPDSFQRRQTLVNAERYISPELKDFEGKVMSAEERISSIEAMLYQELRVRVASYHAQIKKIAAGIALLDALASLAEVAERNNYCCPELHNGFELTIEKGRHPVIECSEFTENFCPNDLQMHEEERLMLLTGPNMSGKSTYIRQVALITLLAQVGSFVPAASARIGLVDQIFTRIGANDDLARGQSTFMVEMTETANILHNATDRSLVILDEIGRGTSTYDGISIAWSVAEFLLTATGKRAKTLFATHYWELTKLEEQHAGAANYHVAVQEVADHIVFLHKIVKGGTDRSYGIHVARLAGMPSWVLGRSEEILAQLEEESSPKGSFAPKKAKKKPKSNPSTAQLTIF